MKKMIIKFMSVFMAVFIICFVTVVPVSASTYKTFTAKSDCFNDLVSDVESEYFWNIFRDTKISGTTVNSDESENQYYIEISGYGVPSSNGFACFYCSYISFDEKPEIYYNSSEDMYYIYL